MRHRDRPGAPHRRDRCTVANINTTEILHYAALCDHVPSVNDTGQKDATMILVCYRHVLRVGELCGLRWDQFDFEQYLMHGRWLKNGRPSVHPIRGMEIRALRRLKRENVPASPYVFTTERRGPMSTGRLQKADCQGRGGSRDAVSDPPAHAAPLGRLKLANDGVDTRTSQHWFGHKKIQNTVRYTALHRTRRRSFQELLGR